MLRQQHLEPEVGMNLLQLLDDRPSLRQYMNSPVGGAGYSVSLSTRMVPAPADAVAMTQGACSDTTACDDDAGINNGFGLDCSEMVTLVPMYIPVRLVEVTECVIVWCSMWCMLCIKHQLEPCNLSS